MWRVKANLTRPVLESFPDGSYRSVVLAGGLSASRRRTLVENARRGADLDPDEAMTVRVVEYEISDRGDRHAKEIICLITTVLDPTDTPAPLLAAAYGERWQEEISIGELKTSQRGKGRVLRSKTPEMVRQEVWAMPHPPRHPKSHGQRSRRSRHRPRPALLHPRPPRPPRHPSPDRRAGGFFPLTATRKPSPASTATSAAERTRSATAPAPRVIKRARHNSYLVKCDTNITTRHVPTCRLIQRHCSLKSSGATAGRRSQCVPITYPDTEIMRGWRRRRERCAGTGCGADGPRAGPAAGTRDGCAHRPPARAWYPRARVVSASHDDRAQDHARLDRAVRSRPEIVTYNILSHSATILVAASSRPLETKCRSTRRASPSLTPGDSPSVIPQSIDYREWS